MASPPPKSSAFSPPPAITNSIRQSTLHLTHARQVPDNILALQRREHQLQTHLQTLLDAQSTGLSAGLSAGLTGPEASMTTIGPHQSTGSSTPTAPSTAASRSTSRDSRAQSHSRSRPPRRQHISLRSARRALGSTMRELATLKAEETRVRASDVAGTDAVVVRLRAWEAKQEGLRGAIERIEAKRDEKRKRELRTEAEGLARDIEETERRLQQMKLRHRRLVDELEAGENQVQSRLASYQSSLDILDSEVKEFLRRPPAEVGRIEKGEIEYLGLPPNRRTLGMARETWERRQMALEQEQDHAAMERDALTAGADMWKEVVEDVIEFESRLRRGLGIMASRNVEGRSADDIRSLLSLMDETLQKLEERFQTAEDQDWRLLVCCIGAELEAFRQGQDILQEALAAAAPEAEPEEMKDLSPPKEDQTHDAGSSEPEEESLFQSAIFKGKGKAPVRNPVPLEPNDDPDPELLVSHQDTDTD